MSEKFIRFISSGCGLGYIPLAPGTFGTLWGSAIFCFFRFHTHSWLVTFTCVAVVLAVLIAHLAEKSYHQKDCQKIVIDEVVGVLIAYLFVSFSVYHLVLGFVLFRLFDIAKIWPANLVQNKLTGGWGIVGDDVVAGFQAGILLYYMPTLILWAKKALMFLQAKF